MFVLLASLWQQAIVQDYLPSTKDSYSTLLGVVTSRGSSMSSEIKRWVGSYTMCLGLSVFELLFCIGRLSTSSVFKGFQDGTKCRRTVVCYHLTVIAEVLDSSPLNSSWMLGYLCIVDRYINTSVLYSDWTTIVLWTFQCWGLEMSFFIHALPIH